MCFIHVDAQISDMSAKFIMIEPHPLTEVWCDTVIQLKQAVVYRGLPCTCILYYPLLLYHRTGNENDLRKKFSWC